MKIFLKWHGGCDFHYLNPIMIEPQGIRILPPQTVDMKLIPAPGCHVMMRPKGIPFLPFTSVCMGIAGIDKFGQRPVRIGGMTHMLYDVNF